MHTQLMNAQQQIAQAILQGNAPYPVAAHFSDAPLLYNRAYSVVARGKQAGISVPHLFNAPLTTRHQVVPGERYDYVMVEASQDPLFHDRDGYPMPQKNLDDLRRVYAADIPFDQIVVVHEVNKGSVSSHGPLPVEPLLPPPSREGVRRSQQFGQWAQRVFSAATAPTLGLATLAVAGTVVAAGTAGALLSAVALVGLDPLILGVVTPDGSTRLGTVGSFHYLTHWTYNEEV